MELEFLNALGQYGPLGLWTASLLWTTHRMSKDQKERERNTNKAIQYHQEQIVERLIEQEHMMERTLEKINEGLAEMRVRTRK